MRFPIFEMERMQSTWEHRVHHDLSESGVEPLTFKELLGDRSLDDLRLGYAAGTGRDATRALVAAIHRRSGGPGTGGGDAHAHRGERPRDPAASGRTAVGTAAVENVLLTTGTSEANFLALVSLVEPGDEVLIVLPNYMQLHGIARGLGATVREVWLDSSRSWRLEMELLRAAVGPHTKVVCVCTPNNPTGQILSASELDDIAAIADRQGAWIVSDEVYRGAEHDGVESPGMWGRSERVIVTGGLSKAYGLPGLRIGWIVAPPELIGQAWAMKDYTTIATATLSERLAEIALGQRDVLLARTRRILIERWPVLEGWAVSSAVALDWTRPRAGAICLFRYAADVDSIPLVDRLIRERSTMVVPGAHFGCERHIRIGFGSPVEQLRAGLAEITGAFAQIPGPIAAARS